MNTSNIVQKLLNTQNSKFDIYGKLVKTMNDKLTNDINSNYQVKDYRGSNKEVVISLEYISVRVNGDDDVISNVDTLSLNKRDDGRIHIMIENAKIGDYSLSNVSKVFITSSSFISLLIDTLIDISDMKGVNRSNNEAVEMKRFNEKVTERTFINENEDYIIGTLYKLMKFDNVNKKYIDNLL